MKIKLSKLLSCNNNLRTHIILGACEVLPQVGRSFEIISGSLTPENDYRYIGTSDVTNVEKLSDTEYIFTTHNSTYRLQILSNDEFMEEKLKY